MVGQWGVLKERHPGAPLFSHPDLTYEAPMLKEKEAEQQQRREKLIQQPEATRPRQQPSPSDKKELRSEKGVDYTRLQDLLKAGQWKEADRETAVRMCEVTSRQNEGFLRTEDIDKFPCTDLSTIDQLWVKHSKGRFGFSVQKKIWQESGNPTIYDDRTIKFGEAVGWKKKGFLGMNSHWKSCSELTFETSAPEGHLPSGVATEFSGLGFRDLQIWVRWLGVFLFSR